MSQNNASVSGLMLPTTKGMVGSTPANSAYLAQVNKSQTQANANRAMAGGKIKKRRHYGGAVTVPQYQMAYTPQGGPGTNPNDIIKSSSQTSTQMSANNVYDNQANIKGGSKKRRRKSRKGGNPDWIWGCMSGGKKRAKITKKNRKTRINSKK